MKTYVNMLIFIFMSKLFGLGRELVLSYFYGTSIFSDVFILSMTIPTSIFSFVAGGLISSYIPNYSQVSREQGEERALEFTNNILTLLTMVALAFLIISFPFVKNIVLFFAKGFKGEVLDTAVFFTRISLLSILTTIFFSVLSGYHQFHGRFNVDPISGVLFNCTIITGIYLSQKYSTVYFPISLVIASFIQAFFSYIVAKKENYKFNIFLDLNSPYLKNMMKMSLPIIVGSSLTQLNVVIDKTIASTVMVGGISILNYASFISDSVYQLFGTTITTINYPRLTRSHAAKDKEKFQKNLNNMTKQLIVIIVPAVFGIYILSEEIIEFLFYRGAFTLDDVMVTSKVLKLYAIGVVGNTFRDLLTRSFFAQHRSKPSVYSSVIGVSSNIILNSLLAPKFGLYGIAIATSISSYLSMFYLICIKRKESEELISKENKKLFFKTLTSSLVMIVSIILFKKIMNVKKVILVYKLVFGVLVGFLVYIITMFLFYYKKIRTVKGEDAND